MKRLGATVLLALSVLFVPWGFGAQNHGKVLAAAPTTLHLFLESRGRCPLRPGDTSSDVCMLWKNFNVQAGLFDLRQGDWGVAYSFNCGKRAGTFFALVAFSNSDGGFGAGAISRHARRGSGYRMETIANDSGVRLPEWDTTEAVEIRSTCAWHIRAIDGTAAEVQAAIPTVPPLYRMNTGKIIHQDKM